MAPFPNLPLDNQEEGKDNGPQTEPQVETEAESSNQDIQGQPQRQPLSEEQIQACFRRANQVYSDPRTNTPRRNTNVPVGRNRNRSATVSYSASLPNLPQPTVTQAPNPTQLGDPVPRIVLTDTNALPGTTTEQEPSPNNTRYTPTLPPCAPRASSGCGRGRPVTVGAYDNPLDESEHRRASREASIAAINRFREDQRNQRQQDREEEEQRSQQQRRIQQQQAGEQTLHPSQIRPLPSVSPGSYPVGTPTNLRRPQHLAGQEPTQSPRPSSDRSQQSSPTGDSDAVDESKFQLQTARVGYTVQARTPGTLPSAPAARPTLVQSFSSLSLQSLFSPGASSQASYSKDSNTKDAPSKNKKKHGTAAKTLQRAKLSPVCEEESENGSASEEEDSDDELTGPPKSQRPRDWQRRDDRGPPPPGGTRGTSGTGKTNSESFDRGSGNEKQSSGGAKRTTKKNKAPTGLYEAFAMASHIPRPGPANLSANAGLDEWLEEAKQCHYLPERAMKELCEMVKEVLMEESNIQPVCTPVTVCGDIHGQFYDLLELFRVAGGMPGESNVEAPKTSTSVITSEDIEPPTEITNPKLRRKIRSKPSDETITDADDDTTEDLGSSPRPDSAIEVATSSQSADTRFVFLGDFVDRGYFSLETFTLLMCLKAKYPDRIVLVRGNHESRQITQVYGFYEECQQKYGNASVWKACCHVFDFLVLAAIVDGELLCVHGGLSPEIRTIDQIRVVARAQEIPHEGAFCDLVWSDPEDVETWAISPRGAGWLFGDKVATEFNHVNGLKLIARAHQLVNEGYKYHFQQNSVVTVWSAPNYCYRCGNVASIMTVNKDMNPKFSIFSAVPDEQRHVPANRRGPGDYFL
ncbi:hypothetical protein ACHAQH_001880 [Verticillium albo-atrum]